MKGWEMVERRGDGKWYAISRSYEPTAYADYQQWLAHAHTQRTFALRAVTDVDTPLVASPVSDPKEEEAMNTREHAARQEGESLALALYALFGKPSSQSSAVFALARRFATFAGYSDADTAFAYVEGFVQAFTGAMQSLQLSSPPQDGQQP